MPRNECDHTNFTRDLNTALKKIVDKSAPDWRGFIRFDAGSGDSIYIATVYCFEDLEAWARFDSPERAERFCRSFIHTESGYF